VRLEGLGQLKNPMTSSIVGERNKTKVKMMQREMTLNMIIKEARKNLGGGEA
jgi:hypothetical protein